MTADSIFLIQDDTKLVASPATPYDSEDPLQQALADFPEVLAGGTTGDGERKLLLVRREMGIATAERGAATFSLDHLFIDTDGVSVLAEVKRSSHTRARGQIYLLCSGDPSEILAGGPDSFDVIDFRVEPEES